jgi:hypothetical protein
MTVAHCWRLALSIPHSNNDRDAAKELKHTAGIEHHTDAMNPSPLAEPPSADDTESSPKDLPLAK